MLDFEPVLWLMVLINLLILYFILKKFFFKRVTLFMENRAKLISDTIAAAEATKAEAEELKRRFDEQTRAARQEADKIISEATGKAKKEYDEMIAAAKNDAQALLKRGEDELERAKSRALKEVRAQVADLALAAASRVIEANMDTKSNRELAERFINEVGAA